MPIASVCLLYTSRWPVKQFAEEAHEHIALFDHETRQQIQEYCELVARLPYDDDAPLGV